MATSDDQASRPTVPNVVFIVGDNVGWGDLGCHGYPNIKPGQDFTGYA